MRISDWSSDVCSSDLAEALLDRAEVLTDHDGAGSRALHGQDVEHLAAGEADVGAVLGGAAGRDPEQAREPHDVIDPKAPVRGHRRPQKLGERPVAHVAQATGYERRKPPALALRRSEEQTSELQ